MYEKKLKKKESFFLVIVIMENLVPYRGSYAGPPFRTKTLTKIKLLVENDYIYAVGVVELKAIT